MSVNSNPYGRTYFPLDQTYVPAPVVLCATWVYADSAGNVATDQIRTDGITVLPSTDSYLTWSVIQLVTLNDPYWEWIGASATITTPNIQMVKPIFQTLNAFPTHPFPKVSPLMGVAYMDESAALGINLQSGSRVDLRVWVKNTSSQR